MEKNLCAQNAFVTFNGQMGQPYIAFLTFKWKMEEPSPTKHMSCAYEKENVLQQEPELNSALAAAKMWLLKGCMLKVKKNLGVITVCYYST